MHSRVLHYILTNLLTNAIKYSVHDSTIDIQLTDNNSLLISYLAISIPGNELDGDRLKSPGVRAQSGEILNRIGEGKGLKIADILYSIYFKKPCQYKISLPELGGTQELCRHDLELFFT